MKHYPIDDLRALALERDRHDVDFLAMSCTCGDLTGKPLDDRSLAEHRAEVEERDAGRWRSIVGRVTRSGATTWFGLEGLNPDGDRVVVSFVATAEQIDRAVIDLYGEILTRLVDDLDRAGGIV